MATAEIISIGTELLLGDVLDTNSQFFAVELARLGIDSFFRTTVGDNKERIKRTVAFALERSDIVITSGGLGPTADDLTTECMAELFNVPLIMDESLMPVIEEFFRLRRAAMPESNRKQGLRPEGAQWLPNPTGTAPGIIWKVDPLLLEKAGISDSEKERTIMTFPGIPAELKVMWEKTAVPFLQGFTGGTLWSCELKHYGIGESALAEKFAHLLNLANPTVAPYAGRGECRLRVTARGESESAAIALAQPIMAEIQAESGTLCYGKDKDSLESVVAELLIEKSLTLAAAESCTGGLISKRLTDIAGSSKFTSLNVVTYSNQAKTDMLKVPEALLLEHGAVSAQCAAAMAQGVRRLSASGIGISVTGIAGPDGGTDEKPVGLVYIGLSGEGFLNVKQLKCSPRLSRQEIRFRCANEALNMVRLYLLDASNLENQAQADDLRIDYRMTITRGIVPQFKRCQLVASQMPAPQAEELAELVRESGILSVQKAFVQRAGNLVTWVLTVEDSNGSHQVSSHSGAQAEDEPALELEDLLNFLNPFLDQWLP